MVQRALVSVTLALFLVLGTLPASAQAPMRVEASIRQPDGKILVAGQGTSTDSPRRILIGRLNSDGSLDTSFVSGGWLTYTADPGVAEFRVTALAVAPDGKIVVGLVSDTFPGLLRLNGDGSPDYTFGTVAPGLVVDQALVGLRMNALMVLSNGDILGIGGYSGTYTNNVTTPAIVHFYSYGPRDSSYGSGPLGVKLPFWSFNQNEAELRAAADWGNGSTFVTAGYINNGGVHWFLVARFFIGGDLDFSFANGGWISPVDGDAVALTVEPGVSITATGHDAHTAFGHDANNFVLAQFDAYGYPGYGLGYTAYNGIFRGHLWIDDYWDASATAVSAARIPGSRDILVAGTGLQTTTGRAYFFTSRIEVDFTAPYGWDARVSPRTEADDVMTGAYPTPDGQQVVAVGTRDSTAGEASLRVRYFADNGDVDTDFPSEGADSTPNPFYFDPVAGAASGATYESATRIGGINVPVSIAIVGGTFSVGCDGNFSAGPATAINGQRVCVRATSSTQPFTTTSALLTVGDAQAAFSLTTGGVPDTAIYGTPANPGGQSGQFTYGALGDSAGSFECRIDTAPFAGCGYGYSSFSGLADGAHTFEVRAFNSWGTDPTPASYAWTVAYVPDTTITSASPNPPSQPPTPSRLATFAFSSNSATATFECRIDAAPFAPCASPKDYTAMADGGHIFQVRAVNTTGTDPTPASFTWTVDATAPVTTITAGPPAYSGTTNASFSFNANEPSVGFEVSLDGAPFAYYTTNPTTYSGLAPGTHTFAVRGIDFAGNVGPAATRTWTIDTTPPDTTITSGPSGVVASPYGSVSFLSNDPTASFECRVETGIFQGCTSPWNTFTPAEGPHTFYVRARDIAGNYDPTPASISWIVDFGPPDTTLGSGPSGTATSNSATFTYGSNDAGASFQCSLDGAAFSACPLYSITYGGLAQGAHTFSVRAVDAVGQSDSTPATRAWNIDSIAPETTIDSGPPTFTNAASVVITFSSNESPVTFQCMFFSGWQPCTSPWNVSAPEGMYTLQVRAIDAAGNVDPTPATRTWIIDRTPDASIILSTPSALTSSSTSTFTFYVDPTHFNECKLDSEPFAQCSSPKVYAGLSSATHVFSLRTTDQAGNVEAVPASYQWVVDYAAPDTLVTSGPSPASSFTDAAFTFQSTESGGTFECRLDGSAFVSCASPVSYSGLADGQHTFEVRAIDAALNIDPTPGVFTWTVDTMAPDTTISSGPGTLTSQSSATFVFASTEPGGTFACSMDGVAYAACSSPATYTGLADGSHTFSVHGIDQSGNTDASAATRSWTVDTIAPDTTLGSGPSGTVAQATATFTFSSPDSTATFECRLDGAAFSACTSPVNMSGLSSASHTFDVRARDPAGNVDVSPASRTWTVDATPPDTMITASPAAATNATSAAFSFTATESATFECKLDAGAFAACTTPKSYTGLAVGSHAFQVRAKDALGNTDATPAAWTWTVDTTAPDTTITGGPSGNTNPSTATFTFTATEAGSTFECKLDNAAYATCTTPKTYTGLAKSSHTFTVRAKDPAGNTDASPATRTWKVN